MTMMDLAGGGRLLVACDAAGAVGDKPLDAVRVPPYVVGRFTARVALMEVVAAGGRPLLLVNNCCVEPEPTGRDLLRGIRDEAILAGLGPEAVTGSFEKNLPTSQTALGVTAIAQAERPPGRAAPGDLVVAVGQPKVGREVRLDDPDIADLPLVLNLARDVHIHDLLPAGSRGIAAEAAAMAATAGLELQTMPPEPGWDLAKSAGPSTCVLAAVTPAALAALALTLDRPWSVVGCLKA